MESPTFTVADLSNISNYKNIINDLKTLILNTVYETCPEVDKRWTLNISEWGLSFTKNNTISFTVNNNRYVVVNADLPYECFCNSKTLADALYKDREDKRVAKRAEARTKEKEIRYNKFLELKKEFEPAT